ncbi:GRIN1 protein, partial [Polypterus senegalus]
MSVDTSQKTSLGKKAMQVQPEPDSIKAVVSKETVVSKAEEDGCLEKESKQEEEKSILNDFCVTGTSQLKHMPLAECSAENQKLIVSTSQKVTDHKLRDSLMKEGAEGNTLPDEPKPYLNKSEENNQQEIVLSSQLVGGTMALKAIKGNDCIISEPNQEGMYGCKKTDNESSSHASHDISRHLEMSTVAVIKNDELIPHMSKNMNIDKSAVKVALSTCRHDKNPSVSAASDSEKAGDLVTENIQKETMHPRELKLTSISNHNMIPATSQNTQEQSIESGKMVSLSSIEQIQQMNLEAQEVKSLAVLIGCTVKNEDSENIPCSLMRTTQAPSPLRQHVEIQVCLGVPCKSAATSPMTPPEGSPAFNFPSYDMNCTVPIVPVIKPPTKDAELQVGTHIESKSVSTTPMSSGRKSPQAPYPEIHIKGATEDDLPEPVREVRWDEKGMTWDVYGASMEVEVLGMVIQKHLEKQIEEHEKQLPPRHPNPALQRGGSLKASEVTTEEKRQQRSLLQMLMQNFRRPQCCSRRNTIE